MTLGMRRLGTESCQSVACSPVIFFFYPRTSYVLYYYYHGFKLDKLLTYGFELDKLLT